MTCLQHCSGDHCCAHVVLHLRLAVPAQKLEKFEVFFDANVLQHFDRFCALHRRMCDFGWMFFAVGWLM